MKTVTVAEREVYAARVNMQRACEIANSAAATMANVKAWVAAQMAYGQVKAKWGVA